MKHYDYELSLFVDGELRDSEQDKLFEHLAECLECRDTLVELMNLKDKSKKYFAEQLPESERAVIPLFKQTQTNKRNYYREAFYFAAAACLLLGFLFLLNKTEETELLNKLSKLNAEYSSLQKNYKSHVVTTDKEKSFGENKTGAINKEDSKQKSEEFSKAEIQKLAKENKPNEEMAYNAIRKAPGKYIQTNYRDDNIIGERVQISDVSSDSVSIQYRGKQIKNKYEARDLLQPRSPYLSQGKVKTDTAMIRDLYLRYGKDKIVFDKLNKNDIVYTKRGTEEPASGYEQYLKSLKTERVTKNDFMTPQVIGN
ncbi:MAG: zf-HC2 domain-containing protein [Ignavibacteriales bacterium]|nr:MAG: zf-HC2 domain-containing protein [Ignavibacteriales bacterium]